MKKIVSLALAMLLVLSLAACGSKNSGTGDVSDALTLLNTVWATYSEEESSPSAAATMTTPWTTLPVPSTSPTPTIWTICWASPAPPWPIWWTQHP